MTVTTIFCAAAITGAQVHPTVSLVGGDDVPTLKRDIQGRLETVLLEMNRLSRGSGSIDAIRIMFSPEAFSIFEQFVLQNGAYTARRTYQPQMISRQRGEAFDVRAVAVKVNLGTTESSDIQNLVFTFNKIGQIVSVRSILPNYDYHAVIGAGTSSIDSLTRGMILDFMERFRIAYNTKDIGFLEKVYSEEALIIVGTVLREKQTGSDFLQKSILSDQKVRLIQLSKQEYLAGLVHRAFKQNAFVNVRLEDIQFLQHEKFPHIYGVSCKQEWQASVYSDSGHLFLMMDFRNTAEPVIHVRSWQPRAFDDGTYVSLYDFEIVQYR